MILDSIITIILFSGLSGVLMNFIGVRVEHKKFGIGEILEIKDNGTMVVSFPERVVNLMYPDAFIEHINALDSSAQEQALKDYSKKVALVKKPVVLPVPQTKTLTKRSDSNKTVKPYVPVTGEFSSRMTYFVFQNQSFFQESVGGYIWAPIENKSGKRFHHWTKLLDVRPGDIIFHGCDASIVGISEAVSTAYECDRPNALDGVALWEKKGRRINCHYIIIKKPIKTEICRDKIMQYGRYKYSPFNEKGTGNQGYLFALNESLARVFLDKLIESNPRLGGVAFIKELMDNK